MGPNMGPTSAERGPLLLLLLLLPLLLLLLLLLLLPLLLLLLLLLPLLSKINELYLTVSTIIKLPKLQSNAC
jgi:hypothetical protein